MLNNGSFAASGSQSVQDLVQHNGGGGSNLMTSQISPRMASPMISSPQQMMALSPSQPQTIMTSSRLPSAGVTPQPTAPPRQSPVVLSARNPGQVFTGGQIVTASPSLVNPVQSVPVANLVKITPGLYNNALIISKCRKCRSYKTPKGGGHSTGVAFGPPTCPTWV